MISSDLPEILGMSDRIAVMRGGTIAAMLPGKSAAHELMAAALGTRIDFMKSTTDRMIDGRMIKNQFFIILPSIILSFRIEPFCKR